MLLYNAPNPAPNPRRVRIVLAEKGVTVPTTDVSIMAGGLRTPEFKAVNPLGQVPALQLDDGTVLTETVAICRYFDGLYPDPPLFGTDPLSAARVDMWTRRAELRLGMPLAMIWQHTHPLTARLVLKQYVEFGESQRPRVGDAFAFLDASLADRVFLTGDAFSMADIALVTIVDFAGFIGIPMPENAANLRRWHADVAARPSYAA